MTPERFTKFKKILQQRQTTLTVVMENIHKPQNFAAMVRSCDAVGVFEVHAVTSSGEISRHHNTSASANKWVNINTYKNIETPYNTLKSKGFQILVADIDSTAQDFRDINYTKPTAIVMGSELDGISKYAKQHADHTVFIPMQGLVESLNVSVATALLLFEAQKQRLLKGLYADMQLDVNTYEKVLFEWSYPKIAKHCQQHSIPYPQLDEQGYLIESLPSTP